MSSFFRGTEPIWRRRWNTLGVVLTSSYSRAIYALPVAGYVILYSDFFRSLFHFTTLEHSKGFMSFSCRVNFIYYGSLVLLVAYGLYVLLGPKLLRGKRDLHEFVSAILTARDRATIVAIMNEKPYDGSILEDDLRGKWAAWDAFQIVHHRKKDLGSGAGEYEDAVPRVLSVYYDFWNVSGPTKRLWISILILVGYGGVLLPSLDLLLRVLNTHYHVLFG